MSLVISLVAYHRAQCLNLIKESYFAGLKLVSMALGFIAFSIGNEPNCHISNGLVPNRRYCRDGILVRGSFCFHCVSHIFLITGSLNNTNIRFSRPVGNRRATAPAATLMVVRQYKAKGALTDTLMSVVAIDDSVAIVLFGILVALANALAPSAASEPLVLQILMPFWEIFASLGIGCVIGLILTLGCRFFTGRGNRISLVIASVFLTIYLADLVGGSTLLAAMALGTIFANLSREYEEVSELVSFVTPPIFIMFFVLSGAELNLGILKIVGLLGFIYIISRVCGKIFGAWFGGKITKAETKITKYLGFALIPQAGVAIGLSLVATQVLNPDMGMSIRAIVLGATLIYELLGPVVTKATLQKAGEIESRS